MIYEIKGNKKFSYKKNKEVDSPSKFIEDGKIYTLCKKNSNQKGQNLLKIVPEGKKGEDRYFYELIYGKVLDFYVFEILDNLNDFSDLLSEVDLWVNDFDSLREYVKYKYAIQSYGVIFKSEKKIIKEKINDYKKKCLELEKERMIYIDTFFTKQKINKKKKKKTRQELDKNINLKKETYMIEDDNDEFISSKEGIKRDSDENEKIKDIKEHITSEEEENDEEEEENKKIISEEERRKILIQLPEETLMAIEKAGLLTKAEADSYIERRRRALITTVRYRAKMDNNT